MSGSVNKVILVGNLGAEPEIKTMQSGKKMANLSLATSRRWKDQNGQYQEKTEWHRVVIFAEGLVRVVENYVHKGSKLYIEGQVETRKWQDQNGQDKYTTEIVLSGYNSTLTMLDSRNSNQQNASGGGYNQGNVQGGMNEPSQSYNAPSGAADDLDDDIPF